MLIAEGLQRRFGDVVALDGLSLTVGAGEVLGFLGPNGSGKTTALRSILGISEPDAGTVTWNNAPVDDAARRRFGYLPEERGLYPGMKIAEQLAYFATLYGIDHGKGLQNAGRWLERLGLADRVDDKLDSLSLGNQQRVQLAAALVHEPELLILDEPFSGLDPVGVDVMANALRSRVEQGVSVVFSSHQLDLVERLCDAVGIIKDGRMHAVGTVQDLRGGDRAVRYRVAVDGASADGGGTW